MRGRMKRLVRSTLSTTAFSLVLGASAVAQTAAEPSDTCPAGAVSVYFAPSEILASNETVELIGRVGGLASACEAEGVDVVAWVDPAEGQSGMFLALERLKLVSRQLVESGVNAARMRVAARVQSDGEMGGPAARNVRIILREGASVKRADSPPPLAPTRPTLPPNAV